ncbi:MAG: N-acetylmuramoyl-L-alanine amidase [Bacteroidota bacterium]|nr:N-acetylmuramoyl-L-alanine amidase [Bacteroidota bacterium]
MKIILTVLFAFLSFISFSQKNSNNFFYVETKDSLPFLKYSLGEDRLGSAKMTYLDSEVILKVVDSFETDYKVQLSQLHSAWIDKKNVFKIPFENLKQDLTDSWKVFGDSLFDYVTIQLPNKIPYKSMMQIDPSRIVIDIFGAVNNTNWITQLSTVKEIKNAWCEQPEDDVMRVFIELKHPQHWGYKIYYDSLNRLTVRVRRQPKMLSLKNLTIAIDAGHGGDNIGASGIKTDILEKDYTLLIAKEVKKDLLLAKAKVIMTREKDTSLSMYQRITYLDQQNPNLLISIHLNSSDVDTVKGVSTYYRYIGFRPLTQAILKSILAPGSGMREFANVGNFNFALSGPTDYPNCLVEVAFLSNTDDEKKILNPKFRQMIARRIVAGIQDFLKNL